MTLSASVLADMSTGSVIAQCATLLSAVCASSADPLTYAELVADLQGPQTMLQLLRFCWGLRRNRRTRRP